MNKFTMSVMVAATALGLAACQPAQAAPVGVRASVSATEGNRESNVGYLGTLGFDQYVAPKTTLGFEVSAQDVFDREDLSVAARVGREVSPNVVAFVSGGPAEVAGNFGYRAGGGVEVGLTDNVFATAEYRYTDLGHDVTRDQGLVGVGLRF